MAKGSVRKKGKKWYYRFYVEDQSGNLVQKEYAGTESKSETEKLLRQAMDDYDNKKFVAKTDNLTVGDLLNLWSEEELKTGTLSNGTVENYLGAIRVVCLRPDGCLELPSTLGLVCRSVSNRLEGFEGFHFHQLRHTYTSNLLSNGAAPKDVQELLGHSDVSTTMNVYAHSTRKAKRDSARLLDKVAGND